MTNENDKPAVDAPPAPSVVGLKGERSRVVPLEFPAELSDGTTLESVTVSRMSSSEVGAFIESLKGGNEFPRAMLNIPENIYRDLDPDDRETVEEAIFDFFPRSLQTAIELNRAIGEDTSQPSQASSEEGSTSTSE
ncbi:hypothetical protein [Bosea sp. (in: a-proteobacteria)]|uniref:hypothetical protein n=1 Tax=Bosea sp. (in: a-proteobacteria) TaxID=1871050 RepID=UPI001AD17BF2|nr:hypothetical protein [Bosea sp. (in: a-proteobacteria)]MBN9444390.1 hypothetical protein [Bosea sp. (in: a-proteobacteria)]